MKGKYRELRQGRISEEEWRLVRSYRDMIKDKNRRKATKWFRENEENQ